MAQTLEKPTPKVDAPLLPFEERTLNYLINQLNAIEPRVRDAFFNHIADLPEFYLQHR